MHTGYGSSRRAAVEKLLRQNQSRVWSDRYTAMARHSVLRSDERASEGLADPGRYGISGSLVEEAAKVPHLMESADTKARVGL
jgi:hypothetical protein